MSSCMWLYSIYSEGKITVSSTAKNIFLLFGVLFQIGWHGMIFYNRFKYFPVEVNTFEFLLMPVKHIIALVGALLFTGGFYFFVREELFGNLKTFLSVIFIFSLLSLGGLVAFPILFQYFYHNDNYLLLSPVPYTVIGIYFIYLAFILKLTISEYKENTSLSLGS